MQVKLLFILVMFVLPNIGQSNSISSELTGQIVSNHRKLIILSADEVTGLEQKKQLVDVVGKIIFHKNRASLLKLEEKLLAELVQIKSDTEVSKHFIKMLSSDEQLWDADKLVFLGLIESLLLKLEGEQLKNRDKRKILQQLKKDIRTLKRIQARYDNELGEVFARFGTRAVQDRRQSWNKYLKFISSQYSKSSIIREYEGLHLLPAARGKKGKASEQSPEVFGNRLADKTLVLTFDDGPHPHYSEKIMTILTKYKIQPIFFHVGENLGKVGKSGKLKLSRTAKISKKLLKSGAVLANHSYSHPLLPKLTEEEVSNEISITNRLIKKVTGKQPVLFRAPYGARNETLLAWIKSSKLSSIMWNIDSKDWADPVPKSIAKRVVDEVERQKKGIILFHDIQPQTVEALPLVLDELISRGYQFAQWDGESFVVDEKKQLAVAANKARAPLYKNSWAVVIGIDEYTKWPKLHYAVNDAKGIKAMLVNKFSFKEENVFTLYNEQATRDNILSLFHDKLGDERLVNKHDRVFIFYAGHGATRQLHSGRELGYIIPVDANAKNYFGQSVSMTNVSDISEAVAAKHLFFVMDSCYSGLALTRGGGQSRSYNFIQENNKRTARQMLTAGGADQEVADGGPNGHSVFTWSLIQALNGKADMNKDSYITASELAAYISPIVSSISLQTPAFGNLIGSQGGDFVFELETKPEFLSDLSEQLDEQELRLNKKLDTMKREIELKRERNIKLKKELQSVKAMLEKMQRDEKVSPVSGEVTSASLNKEGLQLYREKKYQTALKKFIQSANLDPTYVEAVNNAGFVYYKINNYEQAVVWLQKTVALDRNRAVAWLNLADSYYALDKHELAEQAYRRHLKLAPKSRARKKVLEKLSTLATEN